MPVHNHLVRQATSTESGGLSEITANWRDILKTATGLGTAAAVGGMFLSSGSEASASSMTETIKLFFTEITCTFGSEQLHWDLATQTTSPRGYADRLVLNRPVGTTKDNGEVIWDACPADSCNAQPLI